MTADDTPFVRPDVRAFLDALAQAPRPVFTAELLAMIRTIKVDPAMIPDLPVGDLAVVRDVTMPGPGGPLSLRLYDARAERAAGPVVVFFHGGGFCVGGHDTHGGLAAEIARELDLPVVSVEYRLAPEHKWPSAPQDGEAAARWIAENGAAFGRQFTSLIICGDSAGGNLTIVTTMALRDKPAAAPVILQIPIYPGTDRGSDYPSRQAFSNGYGLDGADMKLYDEHTQADKLDRRTSPLLFDQAGMPPTLVVTAGLDPLRDEGRAYAAKTIAAGVPTNYREFVGTIHGFATYRKVIPSAVADVAEMLATARDMLREASPA